MFNINSNNNIITINRGDTVDYTFTINLGTKRFEDKYTLTTGDSLYFGLMEPNQPFECALLRLEFTEADNDEDGNVKIHLDSSMTENLLSGRYYYSIKLRQAVLDGEDKVTTLIPNTKFAIYE